MLDETPNAYWTPNMTLRDVEKLAIVAALKHHYSNKTQTAQVLGISIRTLRNKLTKYKLHEFKGMAFSTKKKPTEQAEEGAV